MGQPEMELFWDRMVGRGSFGDVWCAKDRLGRDVAVKFFNDTTPSQLEQNALNHAKALVRVDHYAVVKVLAVEVQKNPDSLRDSLAVIMEYVSDTSLSKCKGSFSREQATRILDDIAGALAAIHDAGIVHGDLHDGNVMLTSNGAKVIDILYTHTLANVGTKTANQTRADDLRQFAVLARQVSSKTTCHGACLEEAYYRATTEADTVKAVRDIFFTLLEDNPGVKTESKSDLLQPTATTQSLAQREEILQLVSSIQSKAISLASCLSQLLTIAIRMGDAPLKAFCQQELTGYFRNSGKPGIHKVEPSDELEHRLVQFYSSYGVQINVDAFESIRSAFAWMESRPKDFPKIKMIYPEPISGIENSLPNSGPNKLLVFTHRAGAILANCKDPDTPVYFYAEGDVLVKLTEKLRTLLTQKLFEILG